jgi:predicted nucleic acid-binding protein
MTVIKKILLDTNITIKAFDELTPEEKAQTEVKGLLDQVRSWLRDPYVELSITPLIRFEVLNKSGMGEERLKKLSAAMDQLSTHAINNEVATLAAHLSQQVMFEKKRRVEANKETYSDQQERITALKLRFDAFHVATEKVHGLELISHDPDIKLIQQVHNNLTQQA